MRAKSRQVVASNHTSSTQDFAGSLANSKAFLMIALKPFSGDRRYG